MKTASISAFEDDITNCITETNHTLIEVFDCYDCTPSQQRSYIKTEENQPTHFILHNDGQTDLVFAALDNCMLKSHNQSVCDFLIGNFKKLYFVEIKQVNRGQRSLARTNAIQQLNSSLSFFRKRINLTNKALKAVICLKANKVHPLQSATRTANFFAFKETHNASLMEGQSHTF